MLSFVQPSSRGLRDQARLLRPTAAVQGLHLHQGPHQVHHRHHRDQLLLQGVQLGPLVLGIVQLPRLLDLALELDGSLFEVLEDEEEMLIVHLAQVARAEVLDPPIEPLRTKASVGQSAKESTDLEKRESVKVKVWVNQKKESTDLEKLGKLTFSKSGNLSARVPASARQHNWT